MGHEFCYVERGLIDAPQIPARFWSFQRIPDVIIFDLIGTLSHLITYGLSFSFQCSLDYVLPPSLPFVIVHSAIHAFLISRLIVYVTHSVSSDTCTYISSD